MSGPSHMAVFEEDRGCCGNLECLIGSDLVLQIFANLQLTDLLKVRCVCKSWYDAIFSSQFIQLWKHEEEEVWILLSFRTRSCALENYREIWYPSSFMSKKIPSTIFTPPGYIGAGFKAFCSSHGLVCGPLKDYSSKYELVVGNPITNSWKKLPLVSMKRDKYGYDRNRFFMERDPDSGCYTVVILVRGAMGFSYAWQYESKLEAWQKVGLENIRSYGIPTGYMLLVYPTVEPFFELFDPLAMPKTVVPLAYPSIVHEHEEYWKDTQPLPLASFKYKGKHILITFFVKRHHESNLAVGAGLWELDEENLGWKLVSRNRCFGYPERLYSFTTYPQPLWKCQLVGDMIIVSAVYHYHSAWHAAFLPIAYDLLHSTWMIPSYTSVSKELQDEEEPSNVDAALCYAFIPSLKAQI